MNSNVDNFIKKSKNWREEFEELRMILLDCKLEEELKWGKPCYSHNGGNIAIIQGFKNYCALMFFKGSLLKDPKKILEDIGEHSKVGKRICFTEAAQISKIKPALKSLIKQAIEVEKAGLKVPRETTPPSDLPEELAAKLKKDSKLKKAYEALTPGRQRSYTIHISSAKQPQTRQSRVEKCVPKILAGKGFNER